MKYDCELLGTELKIHNKRQIVGAESHA